MFVGGKRGSTKQIAIFPSKIESIQGFSNGWRRRRNLGGGASPRHCFCVQKGEKVAELGQMDEKGGTEQERRMAGGGELPEGT
jgi:hypothetical protein